MIIGEYKLDHCTNNIHVSIRLFSVVLHLIISEKLNRIETWNKKCEDWQ